MFTDPPPRRRPYEPSMSGILIAVVSYRWIAQQVKAWGYVPYRGLGIALTLGLGLGVLAAVLLVDYALARVGIEKRIRSGLWLAAAWGPAASLTVWNEWGHLVWSQVAGIAGTFLGFGLGYFMGGWV